MAMTKSQIIAAIAEKSEITKVQAETALDTLVDLAIKRSLPTPTTSPLAPCI